MYIYIYIYIYIYVYIFTYAHTQTRRFMMSSVSGAVFQMTSCASGAVWAAVGCVLAVAKVLVLPYAAVLVLLYSAQRSIMFQSPSVRLTPLSVLKALSSLQRTCVYLRDAADLCTVCRCLCVLVCVRVERVQRGGLMQVFKSLATSWLQQNGCSEPPFGLSVSGTDEPTHDTTGRW